MADNLEIFGVSYLNATGVKATDEHGNVLSFVRPQGTLSITQNGTVDVSSYASASVNVSEGTINIEADKSATPTESSQVVTPDSGYDALAQVTVAAIPNTYVGSGITRRDDSDLTVSGATVTAPAGYYASSASGSVSSGVATGPASLSATGATVSTGNNTITLSKDVSVTPRITIPGYISIGTAGNTSASLTASVTTKAATTYNTSTTDQTISASQYLTGVQTIKAVTVSGLSADKVLSGTTVMVGDSNDPDRIASVAGSVVIQHIYSGSGDPPSSLGVDGDIYLKVVS